MSLGERKRLQESIGSYSILELIASGGQATVYRAWDTRSGQIIALKVMHPHLTRDETYRERFQREARLAEGISHPNVIRVFEVGEDQGSHFMALEFLPLSLNDLIESQKQLPVDRVVDIARQVALGLQAAHERGIVHRDIKPHNVLIGPDGNAKITDFGISRANDLATMTRTGAVMGTPHYMAPEQTQGRSVDIRSDIYSYGVMLYQMLAGVVPFEADTPFEVMRRHMVERPQPLRQVRSDVPRALEQIVDKCLEKDPDRRYSTPSEIDVALLKAFPDSTRPSAARQSSTPPPPAQAAPPPRPSASPPPAPPKRYVGANSDRRDSTLGP